MRAGGAGGSGWRFGGPGQEAWKGRPGVVREVEVVGVVGRQQGGAAVADRDDAEVQQFGHRGAAGQVAHLQLVAGGGAVGAAGLVAGALEEAGVDQEGDRLADDAGGGAGEPAGVLGGAGGAAPGVDPPGGLQSGGVAGRVGVLALLLGPLLQPAARLADEGVHAVDGDPADVAVVGEVVGAREGQRGDGEVGQAVQEAVGGVGGGAARVVAHPDGEDRVLGRGHGHPGARRDLQHDQAEPGGDRVGEPGERRVLAVPADQLGVLGVPGGQQLGLEAEGDQPGGVGDVGGGDRRRGRRARRSVCRPVTYVCLGHLRRSSCVPPVGPGWSRPCGPPGPSVSAPRSAAIPAASSRAAAHDQVGAAELRVVQRRCRRRRRTAAAARPAGRRCRPAGWRRARPAARPGTAGRGRAAGLGEQAGQPPRGVVRQVEQFEGGSSCSSENRLSSGVATRSGSGISAPRWSRSTGGVSSSVDQVGDPDGGRGAQSGAVPKNASVTRTACSTGSGSSGASSWPYRSSPARAGGAAKACRSCSARKSGPASSSRDCSWVCRRMQSLTMSTSSAARRLCSGSVGLVAGPADVGEDRVLVPVAVGDVVERLVDHVGDGAASSRRPARCGGWPPGRGAASRRTGRCGSGPARRRVGRRRAGRG